MRAGRSAPGHLCATDANENRIELVIPASYRIHDAAHENATRRDIDPNTEESALYRDILRQSFDESGPNDQSFLESSIAHSGTRLARSSAEDTAMRLTYYASKLGLGPHAEWRVRKQATKDAKSDPPIPGWQVPQQPSRVKQLRDFGGELLEDIKKQWSGAHGHLCANIKSLIVEVDDLDSQVKELRERRDEAAEYYKKHHDNQPPPPVGPSRLGYCALLLFLFLFEFPLNAVLFRLFGIPETLTWLVSLGIGLALLLFAHLLGEHLKDHHEEEARPYITATMILLPLITIVSIGYLREVYTAGVQAITSDAELTSEVSQTAKLVAVISINAILFGAATVFSFRRHQKGLSDYLLAKAQLDANRTRVRELNKSIAQRTVQVRTIFEVHKAEAGKVINWIARLVEVYRGRNLERRRDRRNHENDVPESFKPDGVEQCLPTLPEVFSNTGPPEAPARGPSVPFERDTITDAATARVGGPA